MTAKLHISLQMDGFPNWTGGGGCESVRQEVLVRGGGGGTWPDEHMKKKKKRFKYKRVQSVWWDSDHLLQHVVSRLERDFPSVRTDDVTDVHRHYLCILEWVTETRKMIQFKPKWLIIHSHMSTQPVLPGPCLDVLSLCVISWRLGASNSLLMHGSAWSIVR